MKTHGVKAKWLFNFSSSPVGGGLKRLEETAKWFDRQNGAIFLVNASVLDRVCRYSKCNRFIGIKQNNLRRFISDGKYLPRIIDKVGIPDIYC